MDKRYFVGLASPAAAAIMASFVWTFADLHVRGAELRWVALPLTVVVALLMVSRVRYSSFKGSGTGPRADRVPFVWVLIALVVLVALVADPPKVLLTASVLYALAGPVLWLWRRMRGTERAGA